tara:strand:+ start:213 stop:422 length:210 start_codon:yes stop_codon:yes gene_type:complete
MSIALKDKLEEVSVFVGEQLKDYTNEQVIQKVRKEFGLQMYVDHAEELLHEFQQEIRSEKAVAWEAIQW